MYQKTMTNDVYRLSLSANADHEDVRPYNQPEHNQYSEISDESQQQFYTPPQQKLSSNFQSPDSSSPKLKILYSSNNNHLSSNHKHHLRKSPSFNAHNHRILNISNSSLVNGNRSLNDDQLQFDDPIGSDSPSPSHDRHLLDSSIDSSLLSFRFHMLSFLISVWFLVIGVIFNLAVLAIIHERVPFEQPPLPDISFDLLPKRDAALDISEYIIMFMSTSVLLMIICHQYRWIILSRLSIILGLLYLFRALCMAVTQVPVSNPQYYCSPRLNMTEMSSSWHLTKTILWRVVYMSVGMGLSVNGHHTYCGDFIFSGHTVILIISNHFLNYYWLSSRRKQLWALIVNCLYHLLVVIGIVAILIARGHYMVDILLALLISHMIFYSYHTLCHYALLHHADKLRSRRHQTNTLERNDSSGGQPTASSHTTTTLWDTTTNSKQNPLDTWWWYKIFEFFERNTIRYQIIIHNEFQWPWKMFVSKQRQMMIII